MSGTLEKAITPDAVYRRVALHYGKQVGIEGACLGHALRATAATNGPRQRAAGKIVRRLRCVLNRPAPTSELEGLLNPTDGEAPEDEISVGAIP